MDVTQVQSSAGYKTLYPPAANPKTGSATDVSNIGNAASSATTKTSGSLVVNADLSTSANAEIDKYVADLKSGQRLTVIYGLQQNTALKVTNLGIASSAGLVADPNNPGVYYRPGVVNIDPVQPPGTPAYHTYNWGGYGSVQSIPQPTQIINDDPTTVPGVDGGEILILPVEDAPGQQSAQESSQTVYTPAAPALPLTGPVLVASRSNLVPSTDPLAADNVEFGRGLQPPSSDVVQNWIPSPTSPTPPATSFEGGTPIELTRGTVTIEHVPIINNNKASIVTVNADGTTTVHQSSATTTAADLSKYTKGFLGRKTVSANGTIAVYSSATRSTKSEGNALDVRA